VGWFKVLNGAEGAVRSAELQRHLRMQTWTAGC
jgi:hypothetical protein